MAKKRKSVATRLDEVDRTIYSTFCSAANSLSQLYTQAMHQQKLAFQAGERHAMEKLHEWIIQQEGQGSKVSTSDVAAYLQNELDHGGDEPPVSPRLQSPHQNPQPMMQFPTTGVQVSAASLGQTTIGQGPRSGQFDHQPKGLVFSSPLSSPVHQNLQQCHLAYTNNIMPSGNGARNNEVNSSHHQSRESNSSAFNDSSMDMHADTPYHDDTYY